MAPSITTSRKIYSPCGISSFFEICDTLPSGKRIRDPLRVGARGGGFIIKRGSTTRASFGSSIVSDSVVINGRKSPEARTTLKVIRLLREKFGIPYVRVTHEIEPPIGSGFGTSGAGAIGATIALSDLFDLRLSLAQSSAFAHISEIDSTTGLGTVISLVSGAGEIGLVTEPGCYSTGRVDSFLGNYHDFTVICAWFGPIEKASVLNDEKKKRIVNEYARRTLEAVMDERTPESLLKYSRIFAEKTGIATKDLMRLADKALNFGAVGATQNMIGNAVHCLVHKSKRRRFLDSFGRIVDRSSLFETQLCRSGPMIAN